MVAANDLKVQKTQTFKPYVEINLIGLEMQKIVCVHYVDLLNRSPSGGQEEEVPNQTEGGQLVAKVQRDLPLVSQPCCFS